MIDGMIAIIVGLVATHSFLPGGESCSEVMVSAVRFQNWVSLAEAPAGMKRQNEGRQDSDLRLLALLPNHRGSIGDIRRAGAVYAVDLIRLSVAEK